jgi:hypothetical protein
MPTLQSDRARLGAQASRLHHAPQVHGLSPKTHYFTVIAIKADNHTML